MPLELIGTWLFNRKLIKKCNLPGNFVTLTDSMSDQFCISLAIFHLVWRSYQWMNQRKFKLQLIMYMIQSDSYKSNKILDCHGLELLLFN